jgi:SAM-dependent methyltransferase
MRWVREGNPGLGPSDASKTSKESNPSEVFEGWEPAPARIPNGNANGLRHGALEELMLIRLTSKLFFLMLISASLCFPAEPFRQAQNSQKPFEPTVGQQGKDVIWVPTASSLVTRMLDMAKVTSSDYVIDLGSGDGRTVIAAAKRGAQALGIEYNPDMVELSRINATKEGVGEKAQFKKADIFESDFSMATVITMFLLPDLNIKLRPKLLDLKPGTRIVSNTFSMGDWVADETTSAEDEGTGEEDSYGSFRNAMMWIIPAKVSGSWQMGKDILTLTQTYQMIEGQLKNGEQTFPLAEGKLHGDQIHFKAGDSEFSGTVNGGRIQGTAKNGSGSKPWTAERLAANQ